MQKCSACAHENQLTGLYCEYCGTPLKTSAATTNSETVYYTIPGVHIAPPPPPLSAPPYSYVPTATPSTTYAYQHPSNERARPTRSIGNTVLSVLLYLIGSASTLVGIFGSLQSSIGSSWAGFSGLSTFLITTIVLPVVLIRYKLARLRWWQRLLLEIASIIGMTVLLFIVYSLLSALTEDSIPSVAKDFLFGGSLIIYGLSTMFLALW